MSLTAEYGAGQTGATRACVWCGAAVQPGSERLDGRIRCASCGVCTTSPWPTDAELNEAYRGWYRPDSGRFSGIGDQLLRRTRGRLARRLDRIAPPGGVLDVGAGDGSLLDALAARGRRVLGLEREATRPDVRAIDVTELDGAWSAIVFWHALEHMRNPAEQIRRSAELLEPHGVLVIAVPNAGSLQARMFGDRWLALDLPRHLVHLHAEALVERLRLHGLDVERVSYWRGGQVLFGWLHGLVGTLPGDLDLYDAIRRSEARGRRRSTENRLATLAAGAMLAPLAMAAAAVEVAAGRGGTVYVEARHA